MTSAHLRDVITFTSKQRPFSANMKRKLSNKKGGKIASSFDALENDNFNNRRLFFRKEMPRNTSKLVISAVNIWSSLFGRQIICLQGVTRQTITPGKGDM